MEKGSMLSKITMLLTAACIFLLCLTMYLIISPSQPATAGIQQQNALVNSDLGVRVGNQAPNKPQSQHSITDFISKSVSTLTSFASSSNRPTIYVNDGVLPVGYTFTPNMPESFVAARKKIITEGLSVCGSGGKKVHPQNPTILYLHIYKAGGTTMRGFFQRLGQKCGLSWVQFEAYLDAKKVECRDPSCMPAEQSNFLGNSDIVSGHFFYSMLPTWSKYVALTTFRNPEMALVSGRIHARRIHSDAPFTTVQEAVDSIQGELDDFEKDKIPRIDYIRRLTGRKLGGGNLNEFPEYTKRAMENLKTMDAVGITEKWSESIDLFRAVLDPQKKIHNSVWEYPNVVQANPGSVSSSQTYNGLSPRHRRLLKSFVRYEWAIYQAALQIYHMQCTRLLPHRPKDCDISSLLPPPGYFDDIVNYP
eukprot:TRINITY_DN2521_c0_g1::TRINITY_DN2521_c0_g1_i1::g.19218::m.19218 TRINITY_DN2521_c0_g1::TRINITY_DN2521_c0_g1_i1::g.19218  ORF type:complete len:454 (+),score=112.98,Sulfotransfer_2/PF03567.9/0.12,SecG/PF03840.9/0.35 TRINITY_DN2521_c0_g1_i1:104-1363(+)